MTKKGLLIFSLLGLSFASSNPPPDWIEGFWVGYQAGKEAVLKTFNHLESVLEIKKQILEGKLPPCYIDENGRVRLFSSKELRFHYEKKLPVGWYVVIDTSQMTTPQKWWIISQVRMGFNAYDKGSIYIGTFTNENDARNLKKEIEKEFGISGYIVEVKE